MDQIKIGSSISELRKAKGLTQEQFAEIIGVTQKSVSRWETGQNIPDVDKIIALSDYFNVSTDYILTGIEKPDENKKINWKKMLPIVATGLNYIGFIIMLFDAFLTWDIKPFAMNNGMVTSKIISIVFMVSGTAIFYLVLDTNKCEKVKQFLRINIFSYSIIVSLVIYLLGAPYLWRTISYIIVVLITEVLLLKKKK